MVLAEPALQGAWRVDTLVDQAIREVAELEIVRRVEDQERRAH
jgi:hypothetical protein